MKKIILTGIIISLVLIVFTACDEVLPVSKTERLSMFVSDLEAGNYNSMQDHFSEPDMTNDWGTVTSGATYWASAPWDNVTFAYSITASDSTTITATFTAISGVDYTMKFYFVKDTSVSGADVWLIYQLDINGSTELN